MWETEVGKSGFDANQYVTGQIGEREGLRKGSGMNAIEALGAMLGAFPIVGMDMNKVATARKAIDDYVKTMENHLQGIEATANANQAFKGEEVQAAVKTYIEKIKEYCINLVSQLRAFSDKLKDAEDAWKQGTQNIAGSVDTSTGAFSAGTRYTEQK